MFWQESIIYGEVSSSAYEGASTTAHVTRLLLPNAEAGSDAWRHSEKSHIEVMAATTPTSLLLFGVHQIRKPHSSFCFPPSWWLGNASGLILAMTINVATDEVSVATVTSIPVEEGYSSPWPKIVSLSFCTALSPHHTRHIDIADSRSASCGIFQLDPGRQLEINRWFAYRLEGTDRRLELSFTRDQSRGSHKGWQWDIVSNSFFVFAGLRMLNAIASQRNHNGLSSCSTTIRE